MPVSHPAIPSTALYGLPPAKFRRLRRSIARRNLCKPAIDSRIRHRGSTGRYRPGPGR
jgi:hypothetical protein